MADTPIPEKFIFTKEGRRLLVSQLNGIRFAVLGAILVQGLEPVLDNGGDASTNSFEDEFIDQFGGLTLDELMARKDITIGMSGVSYISTSGGKLLPADDNTYTEALGNITRHLIPTSYSTGTEMKDEHENYYGSYNITVSKTDIVWDMQNDIAFNHVCLIGKLYAETDDATFNVSKTQRPVIVGISQVGNGGAQLLSNNENESYIETKIELRFTLDELDYDIGTSLVIDDDTREVLEFGKKFSIINDGLHTDLDWKEKYETISFVDGKEIIDDFDLNTSGSIATTKTMMVADAYSDDELQNQLNGVGLIHLINREHDDDDLLSDGKKYAPQLVFTTIEKNEDPTSDPVISYTTEMVLKGAGLSQENDREAPIFIMDSKPVTDNIAVDLFGGDNIILDEENQDKLLFSRENSSYNTSLNAAGKENILIGSNKNELKTLNGNNLLIKADDNTFEAQATNNILIGTSGIDVRRNVNHSVFINASGDAVYNDYNNPTNIAFINSTANSAFNASDVLVMNSMHNNIHGDARYRANNTIIIGGNYNYIASTPNVMLLNGHGLKADRYIINTNNTYPIIMGSYNEWKGDWASEGLPGIIYGYGTADDDRHNVLEFYPADSKLVLYKDDAPIVTLGGDVGLSINDAANTNMTINSVTSKDVIIDNQVGLVKLENDSMTLQKKNDPFGNIAILSPNDLVFRNNVSAVSFNNIIRQLQQQIADLQRRVTALEQQNP